MKLLLMECNAEELKANRSITNIIVDAMESLIYPNMENENEDREDEEQEESK